MTIDECRFFPQLSNFLTIDHNCLVLEVVALLNIDSTISWLIFLPRAKAFSNYDVSLQGYVFTALHVMQTRYSDENSVRLSVCLSVTRVDCDKTVERSVQIYIPYERTFSLVF